MNRIRRIHAHVQTNDEFFNIDRSNREIDEYVTGALAIAGIDTSRHFEVEEILGEDGYPETFIFTQEEIMNPVLEKRFGPYQKPTDETIPKFEEIVAKTRELANLYDNLCPDSDEKMQALRYLQDAKMWANAAVALWS